MPPIFRKDSEFQTHRIRTSRSLFFQLPSCTLAQEPTQRLEARANPYSNASRLEGTPTAVTTELWLHSPVTVL